MQADQAIFHLSADNNVESVIAAGDVRNQNQLQRKGGAYGEATRWSGHSRTRGDFTPARTMQTCCSQGIENLLRTATLTGNVHLDQTGPHPIQGDAGRVILRFSGRNQLQTVRATDGARLLQKTVNASSDGTSFTTKSAKASSPQSFQLAAPTIDFRIADGKLLQYAETSGSAAITLISAGDGIISAQASSSSSQTVITAGKLQAEFRHRGEWTRPIPSPCAARPTHASSTRLPACR